MQIDKILAGIRETQGTTKTASEAPASRTAAPTALDCAMHDALAATSTKTAAETQVAGPVADVMKIAAELADTEQELLIKESQMLGAAWADAAIARINAWQQTAKVAQEQPRDPTFAKFAAENPELVNDATKLGYEQTMAGLEKMAEDAYVAGYNDTVVDIHKTAAMEFLKAASLTSQVVDAQ